MPAHPTFRKIFPVVASREAMFALTNRHSKAPFNEDRVNGALYAGSWFEIDAAQYDEMLNMMPPLFLRPDMFAMSEFDGAKVAIVFATVTIAGVRRWFLGFCDLAIPNSPEMLRDAIITRETGWRPDLLTREEKLEVIWNATSWEWKGYADGSHNWEPRYLGLRTIVDQPGDHRPTQLCLLDHLLAEQIERLLADDTTFIDEIGGSGALLQPETARPDPGLPAKADSPHAVAPHEHRPEIHDESSTMIDWIGILEELTGRAGWEDADGPDTRVGDDYWFACGEETFARLNVDQGYGTLTLSDPSDDEGEMELWAGDTDDIHEDPLLSRFVLPDDPKEREP